MPAKGSDPFKISKGKSIGGKRGKKAWIKFLSVKKGRTRAEIELEINGVVYWYLIKMDDWPTFVKLAKDNRGKAMAFLRKNNIKYKKLGEGLYDLIEVLGQHPNWMRILKYKYYKNKAEMMLGLRKKRYWFPLTPKVYTLFREMAAHISRGEGLMYIRRYIRRHRGYKGNWNKTYYNKEKIRYPRGHPGRKEEYVVW